MFQLYMKSAVLFSHRQEVVFKQKAAWSQGSNPAGGKDVLLLLSVLCSPCDGATSRPRSPTKLFKTINNFRN